MREEREGAEEGDISTAGEAGGGGGGGGGGVCGVDSPGDRCLCLAGVSSVPVPW